jgi:hypothetical protein
LTTFIEPGSPDLFMEIAIHHLDGRLRLSLCALLFLLIPVLGSAQTIGISELNYNSDSMQNPGDWVEFVNYGGFPVDLTGWYFTDDNPYNRFDFPNGQSLDAGAYLVVSTNLLDFGAVYPGVSNVIGEPFFRFANGGEVINLYNSGGTLVSSLVYEDTVPWPKGADGYGRTLENTNPGGDASDPSNWIDGCMFGSPGTSYSPCDPDIVFSEINYNPPISPDGGDWVELHNRSAIPYDLSFWTLRDRRDSGAFVFPSGTVLGPDEYLVVGRDTTAFRALYDQVTNVIGDFGYNLSGDGEVIRLHRPTKEVFFSVVYNDALPWPTEADGEGYTLELIDPTAPMNSADNWFAGCLLGTPGQAYDPDCLLGHNDPEFTIDWSLISGPSGTILSWPSFGPSGIARVFDMQGRSLQQFLLNPGESYEIRTGQHSGVIVLVETEDGARDVRQTVIFR